MTFSKPGERLDKGVRPADIDYRDAHLTVSTDRYRTLEFQERERELLWMRTWQIAGRADELPEAGDWLVYSVFDQSFVIVRGRDGVLRGFVNACRHRGNALCTGKGRSARFTCPYHSWSYGLDGQLIAVAKPDFPGPVEDFVGPKEALGLLQVPVESFGGFIFLNPDAEAPPLAEFLGEAAEMLAPYHLEEMIPVGMNVRETIGSNWKVVMDAFHEGYHVQGVHPELVGSVDLSRERFCAVGVHSATTVPFGGPAVAEMTPEQEAELILDLPPANFPGLAEALPRFGELVRAHSDAEGRLALPSGTTVRTMFQSAARHSLAAKGVGVEALTDAQMSDYQFWALFPNVFIQVRPGEATVIIAMPHPSGDPNRCTWQVTGYLWVPAEEREARREPLRDMPEGQHFEYFLALEQDFQQMERQQNGLRNRTLHTLHITKQEPKVAHFHAVLDQWLEPTEV